jgi:hypothetical protein
VNTATAMLYIEAAIVAICAWEIAKGFRTGVMHFGINTISINCDRRADPRGFWIYGSLNAMTMALCIWQIASSR